VEKDDETLDKKKRYHKCCNRVDCCRHHMDRSARTHIPLIELGGVRKTKFTCRTCRRNIDGEWFPTFVCKTCHTSGKWYKMKQEEEIVEVVKEVVKEKGKKKEEDAP
jgi:hypothetical protein